MQTHFTGSDIAFLVAGFVLAAGSIFAFVNKKYRLALLLLTAGGFSFRLLMTFIDPFVHIWDEQFHAMVARNMVQHPFSPMLYENAVLSFDPGNWGMNHTWLHKPPLFLWMMALVMKIAGPQIWAVRLPSAILTTLLIPSVYRMGELLSGKRLGYFAAFLVCFSSLQINIVSGFVNTDHNDVIFLCMITFSFRAWMETQYSAKWKWVLLTGLFCGMAVLVKMLSGLLVFGAWGLTILLQKEKRFSFESWKRWLLAFFVAAITAAPWLIYSSLQWPEEAAAEFHLQARHLGESLGHEGPWYYHLQLLISDYGWWFVLLLPPAILVFLQNRDNRSVRIAVLVSIVFVYVFYSVVKTRMPLFCLIVSPLLMLVLASLFDFIAEKFTGVMMKYGLPVLLFLFAFYLVNIGRLEHDHTDRDPNEFIRRARIHNKMQFEKAAQLLPSKDYVLFNCGGYANGVACMFYTGITSYTEIPGEADFRQLKEKQIKMAVFDDTPLPAFLADDPAVLKIHLQLDRCGF